MRSWRSELEILECCKRTPAIRPVCYKLCNLDVTTGEVGIGMGREGKGVGKGRSAGGWQLYTEYTKGRCLTDPAEGQGFLDCVSDKKDLRDCCRAKNVFPGPSFAALIPRRSGEGGDVGCAAAQFELCSGLCFPSGKELPPINAAALPCVRDFNGIKNCYWAGMN